MSVFYRFPGELVIFNSCLGLSPLILVLNLTMYNHMQLILNTRAPHQEKCKFSKGDNKFSHNCFAQQGMDAQEMHNLVVDVWKHPVVHDSYLLPCTFEKLVLYHYYSKSREECTRKTNRNYKWYEKWPTVGGIVDLSTDIVLLQRSNAKLVFMNF